MLNAVTNDLYQIFKKCISSVLPEKLIRNSLKYDQSTQILTVANHSFNLKNKNLYIIGSGKAVQNMAKEAEFILGSKISRGIISIPKGISIEVSKDSNLCYYEGAEHNLPDKNAEMAAMKINKLVSELQETDFLLVLISGGGSALLPLPCGQITLQEKISFIKKLANAGADIKELNTVRKKLSSTKGGKLAIKAQPAQVVSLILSDIVGDPIDLIASGPTVHDLDDPFEAKRISLKYELYDCLPASIKTVLDTNDRNYDFPFDKVTNFIIGSNKLATAEAFQEAQKLSYSPFIISNTVTGNVETVAEEYLNLTEIVCDLWSHNITINVASEKLKKLTCLCIQDNPLKDFELRTQNTKKICLILGGETTVYVKGTGKGGRNQQLALEFSNLLEGHQKFDDYDIFILCAGTDGIDGPTDVAGAIGHKNLISDSKQKHLNAHAYLSNNDSYNFYKQFRNGSLHIITGHTNTNVMDIHLIVIKLKVS